MTDSNDSETPLGVRQMTQLALGLMRSTMLHDTALDFIWLGVMLERVNQTARILDVQHHTLTSLPAQHEVVETSLWLSLLRSLSGFESFMKRNQGRVDAEAVAAFLIGEERFPRSVAYCVHQAYERLKAIRPPEATDLPGGRTLERLRVLDEEVRARKGRLRGGLALHELLTTVVDETHAACDQTVKVSTLRMNALVDMGRELVIAHQIVVQDPSMRAIVSQQLQRNLQSVGKIVRDLQTVSMSLRMVPIKGTFQKMTRLVRDLAAKSGKRITLHTEGDDV